MTTKDEQENAGTPKSAPVHGTETGAYHDTDFCRCRLRDGQVYKGYNIQHNGDGRWQATPENHDLGRAILRQTSRTLRHEIDEVEVMAEVYEQQRMGGVDA